EKRKAKNIVVDPVMVATSGSKLLQDEAINTLKSKLLPLADIITPNIPEAEILSDMKIENENDMEKAGEIISKKYNCACLLKGGHQINDANDYLFENGKGTWFKGKRINNPNTHGTGCTLSSAIAANLAKGYDMEKSIKMAKEYLSNALLDMLDLGKGSGPMNHAFDIKEKYKKLGN
ncbi:MAG: bifunctional hydroxymethylpyrimidine kinase/phosphomethylpyrimidine kinase, partial [Anaerococcus hydrogenalis]|nr:bifunctional hydroxymethylpyrimidine kinase/phosphomethylpyrimidine kinase [Anaerococcus hydrogenalis]